MQTVLISGGTGMVGKALGKLLVNKGYKVIVLSRQATAMPGSGISTAKWDVKKQEMDIAALQEADYIIHLAGAGVMDKKWTPEYKDEIVSSRVESAKLIVNSLKNNTNKVKKVISASAIGWYAPGEQLHTEEEVADDSFLGDTCRLWEESITPVTKLNIGLVKFRIGIVLSKEGGALKEFITPIKLGVAAILGNGKQIISWVHIDDLCNMFLFAIENENVTGVYNAVAPEPVNNKTLTITLAKKMKRLFFIPLHVPTFILKLMLGGRSIEILKSAAVSCKKIVATGFSFQFKNIESALEDLVGK
ncbi:TIGR01777 family oxidoreductase [Ferruginibacter sp. SUN106]|uniref:TIGR01777 family oxidoreductase n=1 Tax=Ferruginibacter sp. SUN106 TaxID=2978348 RepID=UPI003D36C84E